jgi:hypothetical protein
MSPFEQIINRHRTLPEVDLAQGQSIAHSRSSTTRIMGLTDANVQGNVHGGVIMRMRYWTQYTTSKLDLLVQKAVYQTA